MSGNRGGEESRYWYSYQVQKYAMESILKKKGYKNYKTIMQNLIKEADNSNYKNHNDLFMLVRQYFNEEDFKEIAKVYRKIGVQLLKEMQPYFGKE
jgi:ribonucleotide reductase alpha subunit